MNVNIIIKNAKTIAEYKEMKEKMKQLTEKCYDKHKKEIKDWKDGEPLKAWVDSTQHICIEYESGAFWHYSDKGEVLSWDQIDIYIQKKGKENRCT